mmetsp:Transcript_22891/g.56714  ORF Transcript_22891/g.56714 Transcript_22891/m.56714 type:complete len:226 (+) Transcript_22891:632-1309(+)
MVAHGKLARARVRQLALLVARGVGLDPGQPRDLGVGPLGKHRLERILGKLDLRWPVRDVDPGRDVHVCRHRTGAVQAHQLLQHLRHALRILGGLFHGDDVHRGVQHLPGPGPNPGPFPVRVVNPRRHRHLPRILRQLGSLRVVRSAQVAPRLSLHSLRLLLRFGLCLGLDLGLGLGLGRRGRVAMLDVQKAGRQRVDDDGLHQVRLVAVRIIPPAVAELARPGAP